MKFSLKVISLALSFLFVLSACEQLEGFEPTIFSFKAHPASISLGETSTLDWSVFGGPEDLVVMLNPGELELAKTGSVTVSPTETTEYTLSAGRSTKSLTVTVEGDTGGGDFVQTGKLTASDPEVGDDYGSSIALSESNLLIGAPFAQEVRIEGAEAGAVYFLERQEQDWQEIDKAFNTQGFSYSMDAYDINADYALSSSQFSPSPGLTNTLDVYKKTDAQDVWTDTGFTIEEGSPAVGALSGNLLVASYVDSADVRNQTRPLFVYEFGEDGAATQRAVLDIEGRSNYNYDGYGNVIDMSETHIAVIGPFNESKAIFTFESADEWSQATVLELPEGISLDPNDNLVAANNITLVRALQNDQSVVLVFERSEAGWQQTALLSRDDGANYNGGVAVDGDTLVLGVAPEDGPDSVDVFERTGSSWQKVQTLESPVDTETDQFGMGIAVLGDTLMVGAPGDDGKAENSGAVYVYTK